MSRDHNFHSPQTPRRYVRFWSEPVVNKVCVYIMGTGTPEYRPSLNLLLLSNKTDTPELIQSYGLEAPFRVTPMVLEEALLMFDGAFRSCQTRWISQRSISYWMVGITLLKALSPFPTPSINLSSDRGRTLLHQAISCRYTMRAEMQQRCPCWNEGNAPGERGFTVVITHSEMWKGSSGEKASITTAPFTWLRHEWVASFLSVYAFLVADSVQI